MPASAKLRDRATAFGCSKASGISRLWVSRQWQGRVQGRSVATAFVGLFIVVDLAVTWANYAALITLSGNYAAATSDVQRAAYVAAANYPSAVLASRLEVVYSIVDLSFAILLIGLVMLKGVFGKPTAYLALATGVFGIASISGFGVTVIVNAVLATVWILFVGYRLYRLGQQ